MSKLACSVSGRAVHSVPVALYSISGAPAHAFRTVHTLRGYVVELTVSVPTREHVRMLVQATA